MKIVVLLSGGMDSTVAAYLTRKDHPKGDIYALTVDYGQLAEPYETSAASLVAARIGAAGHLVTEVSIPCNSPLTGQGEIESKAFSGIPNTWVPQRNSIFLALAFAYAESVGADRIYVGFCKGAYSPDCSLNFVRAIETALNHASKAFNETGKGIGVIAPLLFKSKPEVIKEGYGLGVDFGETRTCYTADTLACGICPGCRARLDAFTQLCIADPVLYRSSNG